MPCPKRKTVKENGLRGWVENQIRNDWEVRSMQRAVPPPKFHGTGDEKSLKPVNGAEASKAVPEAVASCGLNC
jgi:hypothetical protein